MNLKCKSYKEMSINELINEIARVKQLLIVNKKTAYAKTMTK